MTVVNGGMCGGGVPGTSNYISSRHVSSLAQFVNVNVFYEIETHFS